MRQMHEVRNDARQQFASSIRWWIPKGQKHTGDEWLQEDSSSQERSICERWRCVEILAPGVSCFVLMIAHREKPFQDSFQNPWGQVSTHLGLRTPGTQKELSKIYFIMSRTSSATSKIKCARFPGLQHFITNFYRGPWQAPGWMSSFKRSGPVRSAEHQKRGNGRKAIKKRRLDIKTCGLLVEHICFGKPYKLTRNGQFSSWIFCVFFFVFRIDCSGAAVDWENNGCIGVFFSFTIQNMRGTQLLSGWKLSTAP